MKKNRKAIDSSKQGQVGITPLPFQAIVQRECQTNKRLAFRDCADLKLSKIGPAEMESGINVGSYLLRGRVARFAGHTVFRLVASVSRMTQSV